jgi:hypothetical protein
MAARRVVEELFETVIGTLNVLLGLPATTVPVATTPLLQVDDETMYTVVPAAAVVVPSSEGVSSFDGEVGVLPVIEIVSWDACADGSGPIRDATIASANTGASRLTKGNRRLIPNPSWPFFSVPSP